MFCHTFDKKTLEYKGTFELILGREPGDYFIPVESEDPIEIPEGKKCVFVEEIFGVQSKKFEIVSIKEWKDLQIHLGNDDALSETQKIDENGKIISKSPEELYDEGFYSKEEILLSIKNKVNQRYNLILKNGIVHKGFRFDCGDESKSRVNDAVLEAQTFPEDLVPLWVSTCKVDENGKNIAGTENSHFLISGMDDLLELGKAIKDKWKEIFYERRILLDSLPNKSDSELREMFLN